MSNLILTDFEKRVIGNLIGYLQDRGSTRLACQLSRSFGYAKLGVLSRDEFLKGVYSKAVCRGIIYAARDFDIPNVTDFACLLMDDMFFDE